ncbi:fatty acid synthase alpha subunit Lsd1, partial [Coemansia sp. RSA 988]
AIGHSQGIVLATAFSMITDEQSFEEIGAKALGILMLVGAVPQLQFPEYHYVNDAADHLSPSTEPMPRPLVYVYGINKNTIDASISEFNSRQSSDIGHIHLAITNAHDKFVLAGAFQSTANMVRLLQTKIALPDEDQSRKPFSQRKPVANIGERPLSIKVCAQSGEVELNIELGSDGCTIRLMIHHSSVTNATVQLHLKLVYCPSYPLGIIHGDESKNNQAIRSFYIDTWVADHPRPCTAFVDIKDSDCTIACNKTFTITENHIREFCHEVGNRSWQHAYSWNGRLLAPIELIHASATRDMLRVIASSFYGTGQLNLVHVSNRINLVDGPSNVFAGDTISTSTTVDGLYNTAAGKLLALKCVIQKQGQHFASLTAEFLGRLHYVDACKAFKRDSNQQISIVLTSAAEIAVLVAKEWFIPCDYMLTFLEPGVQIDFCIDSEYRFNSSSTYSSIVTSGLAQIKNSSGKHVCVANIDFKWNTANSNPVIEYLKRHQVNTETYLFSGGGYRLTASTNINLSWAVAPSSNRNYARVGCDGNPIHTNPYVADLAGLPATIVHGAWTSASARNVVAYIAADGKPERIRAYQTEFIGMVLPSDRLQTVLTHIGMKSGRLLVKGKSSKEDGTPVLKLEAEVEQPPTAYVFTGQGTQHIDMGMDLYKESPVAQDVWDRANRHTRAAYGFDLLDIVRLNPKQLTIYFNGKAGRDIRGHYMEISEHALGKRTVGRELPIYSVLSDLNTQSTRYTFQLADGLLNLTQFTQCAQIAMTVATMADMRSKGLVQSGAMFAGHSFGEVCALAAMAGVFSVEGMLDVAFYRGLIMQSAMSRDEQGRSEFGMVSVNLTRINKEFDERLLLLVVSSICTACSGLLRVINYNVRGAQYVVSGILSNLAVLRKVLDKLAEDDIPADSDVESYIGQTVTSVINKPIDPSPIRGTATIPLRGIDVPSHSEFLLNCVPMFREILRTRVTIDATALSIIEHHYIPNLTGAPFEVSKGYFEMVLTMTKSPVVDEMLASWSNNQLDILDEKLRLAEVMVVELLAYQLASPVQWIKTQDYLFSAANVRNMVEIGPAPVLCDVASKALCGPEFVDKSISLLHIGRDKDTIYYALASDNADGVLETTAEEEQPNIEIVPSEDTCLTQSPLSSDKLLETPQIRGSRLQCNTVSDVPLRTLDIVHTIVASKIKKSLGDVPVQQNIKTLVAGKSVIQNEIIGDLQREFGGRVPDRAEEVSLQELSAAIGESTGSLGKHTQPLVMRLFSSKMPGGFSLSNARSILQTSYGLGPQRQDAMLLVALTMEPQTRLASKSDASAWLDSVAKSYASRVDIKYTSTTDLSASEGQVQVSVASSAAMEKLQQEQREHVQRQIEVLARYVGVDLRQGFRVAEHERVISGQMQTQIDGLHAELGDVYVNGIQPCFAPRKARRFNSYWNWARQDAYQWIQQTIKSGTMDCCFTSSARVDMLKNRTDLSLLKLLSGSAKVLSASGDAMLEPALQLVNKLYNVCKNSLDQQVLYREHSMPMQPHVHISAEGEITYVEIARADEASFEDYVKNMKRCGGNFAPPLIHIREQTNNKQWVYNQPFSALYFKELDNICSKGVSFAGKTALVTGCGRGSIGAEIVCCLLMGGAKVLATTSSYSRASMLFFEDIYRRYGARDSELIVVPFNQGSVQDIESLILYIFDRPSSGNTTCLGWDLDFVFPFAAVFDIASISELGSRSELAQRVMLTNVLRLMGCIKAAKERSGLLGRPSVVVLPNSSNHGNFGGDGLYGECKSALETALNRWRSEGWGGYLSIIGAQMGRTRGTGLMSPNNLVAQKIESAGVRTFSSREMAFNTIGLLCPLILDIAYDQPIYADLNGGLDRQPHIGEISRKQRMHISQRAEILRLASWDAALDYAMTHASYTVGRAAATNISPLARFRSTFPAATEYSSLQHLRHLRGMVNLDKVVVITGYGEVGPYGNAETRWEVEAFGELSMEGCIELAWIMGLIKHTNGPLPDTGRHYTGWVDVNTGKPIRDIDIKPQYNDYIVAHTGVRLIEPDLVNGYDPAKKQVLREVQIEHDMEPFETGAQEAAAYKKSSGNCVDIWENSNDSSWSVRFLKGALIRVPVSVDATRLVAALLPTGWSASHFGVPEDVTKQVDPVTLYILVATVEALVRSGITDPYELYQHFHVTEIGNSIGSGLGGANAVSEMSYRKRLDQASRSDTMQETFISTIQAWVNMLLMSGTGPVKPSVGACATAALSIDTAIETIQSGKARVMLAGGVDDIFEESMTEFSSMGATVNTIDEYAQGRTPSEMSRPCTSTRKGFMEGHGAGVAVLMSASAALEYGAPIYGVIGMSATATDKQGRSVPAPGRGVVSTARETRATITSRLLSVNHRSERLNGRLRELDAWKTNELCKLKKEMANNCNMERFEIEAYAAEIEVSYMKQRKSLQDTWGNEFWKQCADISPLRGSLAVWGLTADDIDMASFHGTSTRANDINESNVLNTQLGHIGRTPGYAVPVVCQKWLTGHPKGAAASFMLNGTLQSLRTGLIPGNRNADNIGSELKKYTYPLYLSKAIQTTGIKAVLLKSFGFGQVGSELLVIHPDYVLATIDKEQLESYNAKVQRRNVKSDRYWQDTLVGNHTFVQIKSKPPYTAEQEMDVYLDPLARVHFDPRTKEYKF